MDRLLGRKTDCKVENSERQSPPAMRIAGQKDEARIICLKQYQYKNFEIFMNNPGKMNGGFSDKKIPGGSLDPLPPG